MAATADVRLRPFLVRRWTRVLEGSFRQDGEFLGWVQAGNLGMMIRVCLDTHMHGFKEATCRAIEKVTHGALRERNEFMFCRTNLCTTLV